MAVNLPVAITVSVALLILLVYDLWLKRIPVASNLTVALLSAMTFMTGGWAVDYKLAMVLPGPLIPAAFAFFYHLVREILKDAEDVTGDRKSGVTTLPQLVGVPRSVMIALALFFFLVLLTYIPIFAGWFGKAYEVITVYIVDLPILMLLIFVWGDPSPRMLRAGSIALKAGMALGLVALVVA
jgi:4-hydroxybenzoate polyprenyltransferase